MHIKWKKIIITALDIVLAIYLIMQLPHGTSLMRANSYVPK